MKHRMFLPLTLLLVGCSAAPPIRVQQAAPEAPHSRVRFVTETVVGELFTYEDRLCNVGEQKLLDLHPGGAWRRLKQQHLGMPLWDFPHQDGPQELYVPAGKSFYGVFEGYLDIGIATTYCNSPIGFLPEAGKDYEVRFTWSPACGSSVAEIVTDANGQARRVPAQQLELPGDCCGRRRPKLFARIQDTCEIDKSDTR